MRVIMGLKNPKGQLLEKLDADGRKLQFVVREQNGWVWVT
jgi:hypothetical protein